jgi:sugar phosphate isomerase/epimerase
MKRRDFLKSSASAVLATTTFTGITWSAAPKKLNKLGVQLYSVRSLMGNDFEGTIAKVAEAGYDQVEFAGYYDRKPEAIKTLLDKLGLDAPASHLGYDLLKKENIEQTIQTSKILGHEYLILPSLPRERSSQSGARPQGQRPPQGGQRSSEGQPRQRPSEPTFTVEQTKEFARIFNQIGEACHKAGLRFAYHNHRYEFANVEGGGGIMYDILLEETNPELVEYEMDLGWAIVAGADPLAYFKKYPGRITLVHVKDFNEENESVPVGKGKIDYKPILAKAEEAGIKYYIVEYEGQEDPLGSIEASAKYLKNLNF